MPDSVSPTTEEQRRADLWAHHARCVALADSARERRAMKEWEAWSKAAAEVVVKLA